RANQGFIARAPADHRFFAVTFVHKTHASPLVVALVHQPAGGSPVRGASSFWCMQTFQGYSR
ncbi:MAG: hypothetical protein Q8L91_11985, partial [Polaromonas sp.]|nr:hypothetical protein [Polaromonas sp.]